MITVIEDDILFTQKEFSELRFEKQNLTPSNLKQEHLENVSGELWVYDVSQSNIPSSQNRVGSLFIHYDQELHEAYEDTYAPYEYEDIHFVCINNEVVTLNRLNLKREWE